MYAYAQLCIAHIYRQKDPLEEGSIDKMKATETEAKTDEEE